ncbi:MAG: hypothetical protein JXD23_11015 [Spirochaetales bacterium]|nr:hypothetical protein [Spirochaetales bacterium]
MQYARAIPFLQIAYPAEIASGAMNAVLDASASHPLYEGVITPAPSIISYAWTQTAGPAVPLRGTSASVCAFDAPAVGVDTEVGFTLTVTDDEGLTAEGTVTVMVKAP